MLAQTLAPARILVVDDGSTDDTRTVVESFGGKIEYWHKANGGKASALNLGLAKIAEPLVWIFDDDDLAEPSALEVMTSTLLQNPEAGFAYGPFDIFVGDGGPAGRRAISAYLPSVPNDAVLPALLERCFIFQGGMLVRRSCYAAVGAFDEQLVRSQDYEMLLRLARRFPAVRVDRLLFHQRRHAGVRGTAAAPVPSEEIDRAWRDYDKRIFKGLHGELPLHSYLPTADPSTIEASSVRRLALLKRFVVFARKDLWTEATADFQSFVELASEATPVVLSPAEIATLEQTFEGYGRGLLDFAAQHQFRACFEQIESRPLKGQIGAALMTSLTYPIRSSLTSGSLQAARLAARAFLSFCGSLSLRLYVRQTLRRKLARSGL